MLEFVWGLKTVAAFDVWTIEHILTGISAGSTVKNHNKKHLHGLLESYQVKSNTNEAHKFLNDTEDHKSVLRFDLIGVLLLAYLWESLEHYFETGLLGSGVEYWFQGVEFWPNRLITDPLMLVFGYYLAKRFPAMVWPARGLSLLWLVVHLFVFPHSMYLHYIF